MGEEEGLGHVSRSKDLPGETQLQGVPKNGILVVKENHGFGVRWDMKGDTSG